MPPRPNIIHESDQVTQRDVILLGGGGHAKVVADCVTAMQRQVIGFLDDRSDAPLSLVGTPWLGSLHDGPKVLEEFADALHFAALGDNTLRLTILKGIPHHRQAVVIHPSAIVSDHVRIEAGVFVGPLTVVNSCAAVEQGAILNTSCVIEHDCFIGAGAHIAPGAVLGGAVKVGALTLVGLGARVLPGITIGASAVIGAGAVVTRDVHPGQQVKGSPAR